MDFVSTAKEYRGSFLKLFSILLVFGVISSSMFSLNSSSDIADATQVVVFSTILTYVKWGVIGLFICLISRKSVDNLLGENVLGLFTIFSQLMKSMFLWLVVILSLGAVIGGIAFNSEETQKIMTEGQAGLGNIIGLVVFGILMYMTVYHAKSVFNQFLLNKVIKKGRLDKKENGYVNALKSFFIAFNLRGKGGTIFLSVVIISLAIGKGLLGVNGFGILISLIDALVGVVFCLLMSSGIAKFLSSKLNNFKEDNYGNE